MSETSPEYRLPDGTYSVDTGVGRTVFAAPALLSAERLAEIQAITIHDYEQAPEFAIGDVAGLLEHVAALTAQAEDAARELSYEQQMRQQTEAAMITLAEQVAGLKVELAEQEADRKRNWELKSVHCMSCHRTSWDYQVEGGCNICKP